MSTTSESIADLEAVMESIAAGKPVNQEVSRRIDNRARGISEQILKTHGVLNIAVDLIRAGREE